MKRCSTLSQLELSRGAKADRDLHLSMPIELFKESNSIEPTT